MSDTSPPKRDGWMVILYSLLLIAGLILMAMGLMQLIKDHNPLLLGLGVLAVVVSAATYPIASALSQMQQQKNDANLTELLQSINDRLLISDAAKRIAYRRQDRNALRSAIQEDMARSDYDAALVLVEEMGQTYGYREEAEKFREEILATRKAEMDAKIDAAVTILDQIIHRRDWVAAMDEAAKIRRLFPESSRVIEIGRRVQEARSQYKRELEARFLHAAQNEEVDIAMDLLKELDQYLSEDEAVHLRQTARSVIGKKRENMGVQFKIAVHDKEWSTAVSIGEQIMQEFPNTRMADEVRGMLDVLRQRSASTDPVSPAVAKITA